MTTDQPPPRPVEQVMVSWVMNVARTPSLPAAQVEPLRPGPP